MTEPVAPSEGRGVVHLFCKPSSSFDQAAAIAAIEKAQANDVQVVTVSMLGHKADVAIIGSALLDAYNKGGKEEGLKLFNSLFNS